MKIHTFALLIICNLTAYTNIESKIRNDKFDQETQRKIQEIKENHIIAMDKLEQNIQQMKRRMQQENEIFQEKMNAFHEKMRSDQSALNTNIVNIHQNQNNNNYQQSSNSLRFSNAEKTIKIIEQKDNASIKYIITVTDKTSYNAAPQEQVNTVVDLQKLASYLKKTFRSQSADKILEACIHALTEEHKNRILNVNAATHGNETKYTIEVAHKMKSETDQNSPAKKQSRKNKKSAHRS